MISDKIKNWLKKEPKKEEEIETIEKVSVDDFKEEKKEKKEFKMAPEVKAEVREEDMVKKDGDGNIVPSFL